MVKPGLDPRQPTPTPEPFVCSTEEVKELRTATDTARTAETIKGLSVSSTLTLEAVVVKGLLAFQEFFSPSSLFAFLPFPAGLSLLPPSQSQAL